MSKLTSAEHQRICDLALRGFSSGRIAHKIGRHPATVSWFMYCKGLKAPSNKHKPVTYLRKGVTVRQYSSDEDAYIEALRVQKYTFVKIAEMASKRFGANRTAHSVHNRIIMLSAREDAT